MATLKPKTGARLSIEEFLELPDTFDKRKMELDEGVLYVMPRSRTGHQFLQMRLAGYLERYLDGFDQPPANIFHEVIVELSLERRVLLSPDLAVVLSSSMTRIADRMIEGAPDIVVEILPSDRNRDLVRKRRLYAEAGVQEYWIVDPGQDAVSILELRGSEYAERALLDASLTLETPLLPGLTFPLSGVFHHPRRPTSS